MKVLNEHPPNYPDIVAALGDVSAFNPVFAYSPNIYNPFGRELTADVIEHEKVHLRQQSECGVELWYNLYLHDSRFRLEQEIEAYAEQYRYGKEKIDATDDQLREEGKRLSNRTELLAWLLDSLASELSGPAYGNLIAREQAKTAIRRRATYSQH